MSAMNRYFYFVLCSTALLFASCSNPLDKEFNRETAEADFTRLVKLGKVDSTDASMMAHFMVEHNLIGAQVLEIGATYRDILGEAKAFWRHSGKVAPARGEEKVPRPSAVTVEAKADIKKIQQSEWSSSLPYTLTISNISEKPIKAFKGRFIFTDAFGEPLHEVEYKYLNVLQPNDIVEQQVNFRILHIVSPNKIVQYSEHNPFAVRWQADSVISE
jgi:hypothetical protein